MPVQLEKIEQATTEDQQDLIKIYKAHLNQTDQQTESWLQQQFASGEHLFAGRFNSRLLVAVWVDEQTTHHWQLKYLCVRDITRRRGVARQLMQLLAKHAHQQQASLIVDAHQLPEVLLPLLTEIGVHKQQQQWLLTPKGN